MTCFDTFAMVDWSAARRAPERPGKDSIWIGVSRRDREEEPLYFRTRIQAETWIAEFISRENDAGRRVLIGFDFPFGYPRGFARVVTGSDDPVELWYWLESRIRDDESGENNRFEVAEELNALFEGPGPFWGKPAKDRWPGVPYRKRGIGFDRVAERRAGDIAAKAASSCFQLAFPPSVGSQVLMGLPMLARLRRRPDVAVWPFDDWTGAKTVLAEIWPGLIEPAVRSTTGPADQPAIRDREQVRLMARAFAGLLFEDLSEMMRDIPEAAREEAWILGTGHADRLVALAGPGADVLQPPPLRNDCFALPAGVDWTPVDEALGLLKSGLSVVTDAETVALPDALNRVLARDALALRSNPPQANSAVDGYGFAGPVPEGAHVLPLVGGRSAAGAPFAGPVPEGHAIRILTGATLPDGVDTVVLEEDVRVDGSHVAFRGPLKAGANARKAGEDVREGDIALSAGRVVTPADLALLSAVGISQVDLRRQLRVAVVSTGDELVDSGEQAAKGRIFDANRPMLLAMIARFGFKPVDMGRVGDDRGALKDRLDAASAMADAILTSGGASAGDEDHVSALLKEAGAMQEWRIAMKPGRPLALGLWHDTPVFGLPGNPVAAMVCTLIFARPALSRLAGADWTEPQGFLVPAAFEKNKKPGRREYLRARVRNGRAEVFASEGSGRISGLSWAEGLVEIEDGARHIRPGDPVRFIPYGSFGL
ncbi:molybdopterin-binding protein [Sedimentitalea sp. JM2-8]|uniref:Molybdopterin molybdenumtransferase n=1 Tax=Sedimentitalea xiamensis TaxID=3050037 RepID=A0ABT7FAW6_9RHOB|nr:gephyrin-like molybdotransferase Glp [Sedimentitalea xiamensis]MDK3072263.1 molybdopterin-binding protein [Sedimentitalea xiamensis]